MSIVYPDWGGPKPKPRSKGKRVYSPHSSKYYRKRRDVTPKEAHELLSRWGRAKEG